MTGFKHMQCSTDGVGGNYTKSYAYYAYKGARFEQARDGFHGFQQVTFSDNRANTPVIKTYYKTAFPYAGMVYRQEVFQNNGATLISRTDNVPAVINLDTTANNQRYFPYISSTTTDTYEVGA